MACADAILNVALADPRQQEMYSPLLHSDNKQGMGSSLPNSYNHNLQSSPLLSLPVELRLIILQLVLTDVHIHIRGRDIDPQSTGTTSCDRVYAVVLPSWHPPLDFISANSSLQLQNVLLTGDDASTSGKADTQGSKSTVAPALLSSGVKLTPVWRTSRQIYNESIHLPFSSANSISFDRDELYFSFLDSLPPQSQPFVRKFWVHHHRQSTALVQRMFRSRTEAVGGSVQDVSSPAIEILIPSRAKRLASASTSRGLGGDLRTLFDAEAERTRVAALTNTWQELGAQVSVVQV